MNEKIDKICNQIGCETTDINITISMLESLNDIIELYQGPDDELDGNKVKRINNIVYGIQNLLKSIVKNLDDIVSKEILNL